MNRSSSALASLLLAWLVACASASGDGGVAEPGIEEGDATDGGASPGNPSPETPSRPSNAHCDITKPLANLEPITAAGDLNLTSGAITFSSDGLTLFVLGRAGGLQTATRASTADAFGALRGAGYGNGRYIGSFSMTRDGLSLYSTFSIAYDDGTISDEQFLYVAKRSGTSEGFGAGTRIAELGRHVIEPYIAAGGDVLYLVKEQDLYQAVRVGSSFGEPTKLAELSTDEAELTPVISGDGLTLFFKRGSRAGGGLAFYLWSAYRESTDARFEAPTKVAQLADPDDNPKWASEDGCTLYLERRTSSKLGLWQATFAP